MITVAPPVFAPLAGENKEEFLLTPRAARGGGGSALKRSGSDETVGASADGTIQLILSGF